MNWIIGLLTSCIAFFAFNIHPFAAGTLGLVAHVLATRFFARLNQANAERAMANYVDASFRIVEGHPDFIKIIVACGDDADLFTATLGQLAMDIMLFTEEYEKENDDQIDPLGLMSVIRARIDHHYNLITSN